MNPKIKGRVIHGDGYGRKLGFPTVNLATEFLEFPPEGVYTGNASMGGENYRAGIIIGPKTNGQNKIEAHLLGYSGDAYGQEVELEIKKFLRAYIKFETEQDLINQIKKDIEQC